MADTFFGFNTDIPTYEDEPLSELDPSLADDVDLLNEDTFGSGALDGDWEDAHRKLAELEVGSSKGAFDAYMKGQTVPETDHRLEASHSQVEHGIEDLDGEEMLEHSLVKLVDDDDADPTMTPSRNKGVKSSAGLTQTWSGESPLLMPESSKALHELISPESYVWGIPPKLDKENAKKGSSNTQATAGGRGPYHRPVSPACEDESIVKALPRQDLLPPSQFSNKSPLPANAIRLEDLERKLTTETPPRPPAHIARLDAHGLQQGRQVSLLGRPPPGIPRPMMTPRGPPPMGSPILASPGMRPLPPHMFHNRPSPSPHMPNPAMYRTPQHLHRPQYPMAHSDPGHIRHRRGMDMPVPMNPQQLQAMFSSPQHHVRPRFDGRRNWQHDTRGYYNNNNNQFPRPDRNFQRERYEAQNQPSDLERKIHEILVNAEEQRSRSEDPYAGLMTRRDKEWLIKIQLLQLTSSNPQLDDYYFQMFTQRKASRERGNQEQGIEQVNLHGNPAQSPKMALPQFEREERSYKPKEFQGSLGKLSSSSVQHPRQMVDLSNARRTDQDKGSSVKDYRRRGRLLSIIEKGYDCLLNIEDLDKKYLFASELEKKIIVEAKRVWRGKFFPLLKLKTVDSGQYDDELFVQILSIRKGKTLLGRVVPLLSQEEQDAVSLAVTRNIAALIKRDGTEEGLLVLVAPLSRALQLSSWSVILQALSSVVRGSGDGAASPLPAVLINKFGTSILGTLLGRVRTLSNSLTEADEGRNKLWPDLVKTVAEEFQAVPAKLLSRNLESSTRLADLMAGCTDSFTSAAVQEHLRNASTTNGEIRS